MQRLIVLALVATLVACAAQPVAYDEEQYASAAPASPEAGGATSGAIYAAGTDLRLFEDLRARRAGDILTIRLVERTDASKSAKTSTKKGSSVEITDPVLAGRPVTADGTPILEQNVDAQRSFAGEGGSSQSNRLSGAISVTVVRRLPNGNLEVRGDKWITINQGRELVRISGVVRPYDVQPDNSVSSEKVADARIVYSGRGTLAEANAMGWLTRFFNAPVFPL